MAKCFLATCVGIIIAAAAGCQSTSLPMIASVPPPSFTGPVIAPPSNAPARAVAPPLAAAPSPLMASALPTGPRAWIPKVAPRPWKWIVIHHSATPSGNMALFDKEHKAKGWDGVGYDFVIGNGTDSGDGQVEVTPRWPIQKWGAHAKTVDNRYNEYGIGICLVGNFDIDHPSAKQMQSLTRLVSFLMQTYHIAPENILGHRDTKQTDCPGRLLDMAMVRRLASQALASAGAVPTRAVPAPARAARAAASDGELLGALPQQ
jgi:hypothetical protein